MPFPVFQESEDTTETKFAKKLYEILSSHGRINGGPAIKRGAEAFRLLHTRDGIPIKDIKKTLNWYSRNIKEDYTPICHNANSFRRKFPQIKAAMERAATTALVEEELISDEARFVLDHTKLIWPGDEKEVEATFVHQCVDNYQNYLLQLYRVAQQLPCETLQRLAGHLLKKAADVVTFTIGYIHEIHQIAYTWENWKGNLMKWVFDIEKSKRFAQDMRERTREYCGDPKRWDELVKQLKRK